MFPISLLDAGYWLEHKGGGNSGKPERWPDRGRADFTL